jgi:hypothetical protein
VYNTVTMKSITRSLASLSNILDQGWMSRLALVAQFLLAWKTADWSWAVGSTAITLNRDLLGTAALIGAVAAAPQALLMMATNKYMEMRNAKPSS